MKTQITEHTDFATHAIAHSITFKVFGSLDMNKIKFKLLIFQKKYQHILH